MRSTGFQGSMLGWGGRAAATAATATEATAGAAGLGSLLPLLGGGLAVGAAGLGAYEITKHTVGDKLGEWVSRLFESEAEKKFNAMMASPAAGTTHGAIKRVEHAQKKAKDAEEVTADNTTKMLEQMEKNVKLTEKLLVTTSLTEEGKKDLLKYVRMGKIKADALPFQYIT